MNNRNRDSNPVLSPRIHHSSYSASSSFPHSPTVGIRYSSPASSPYPRSSSSTAHHGGSPSMSLFTPTRTEVVREELAQCEGMDTVIQYDDVRGYFHRVGLPTPDSIPRRKTMHHMSLSLSSSTRTMPMSPIVGTPTAKALPPPIQSLPAMKSLTPPLPLHHGRQTSSLFSSYHAALASSSSGCTGHQWQTQPMASPSTQPRSMFMPADPNSLLSPTPKPIQQHQRPQPSSSSSSSSHQRRLSSSSSLSRRINGQPIASGSSYNSHTHTMPPAPVLRPSRTVRHKEPKSRSDVQESRDSQSCGGVQSSSRTREEGSIAHTSLRKRSASGGIRIVTVYDVRGFEGVEPDPRFPNMMVVDRTGGEAMVVYRSGDVNRVGYGLYDGGTGTIAMGMQDGGGVSHVGAPGASGLHAPGTGNSDQSWGP
ncbi:hypothetical protein BJ165DRAFT_1535533 [Panaeolus papilionaceus]|nr:hypothetical protein BJ165DRAFT_1535533 [Panaeolus papilionaceus]